MEYSSLQQTSPLQELTCHMAHSVTCHPAEVTFPPLPSRLKLVLFSDPGRQDMPSVILRGLLGGRKGIRPVKNCVMGCWHGYVSGS